MKMQRHYIVLCAVCSLFCYAANVSSRDQEQITYIMTDWQTTDTDESEEEDKILKMASCAFDYGDCDEAIHILKAGEGAEMVSHRYLLASIYQYMDSVAAALPIAYDLFIEMPDDVSYRNMLRELVARDPNLAVRIPLPLMSMTALQKAALFHTVAEGCLNAGRYTMADRYVRMSMAENSGEKGILLTYALIEMNLRQFSNLPEILSLVIESRDRDQRVAAMPIRGRILNCLGRHDEAISMWESHADDWEGYEPYYYPEYMGQAYAAAGRYQEAIEWYDKALKAAEYKRYIFNPNQINPIDEIRIYRGMALYRMGDKKGAIADMKEAIAHGDKSPIAYAYIGDRDEAMAILSQGYGHSAKAAVFYVLGDVDRALDELGIAFEEGETFPESIAADLSMSDIVKHSRFASVAKRFKPA